MNLKPQTLAEFPGQDNAKSAILPSLLAAKHGKPMGHLLLSGPAGTGKTTLAEIIARELQTSCVVKDARAITSYGQFLDVVQRLNHNDVFFIEEIHGLDSKLEERFYDIIDNFSFWHTVGNQQIRVPVNNFVLVGATTKIASISTPLRSRFDTVAKLDFYDIPTLVEIALQHVGKMGLLISADAAVLLAESSRGVARTLGKLLNRADDFVTLSGSRCINMIIAQQVLKSLSIHANGLHDQDMKLLAAIKHQYKNQPVGLTTLAAFLGDSAQNIEEAVEPYLLRKGLVLKTTRGRMLTSLGLEVAQ